MIRIFETYLHSHTHSLDAGDVSGSAKHPSDPTAGFAAGFKAVGGLTGQQKGSLGQFPCREAKIIPPSQARCKDKYYTE